MSRAGGEANVKAEILNRPWYIVIEGAIGVGKTTLARMLRDHFQAELLLEVFEENPFLSKFYESRATYAFQTQMFFLLSRYRQQQQVPKSLSRGALISDYMFAKDWLFARLNLSGDEWEVYQQIHRALAEQIPTPTLIVYLQADTDVLMGRIAQRDRPYERDMDRDYIDTLHRTYEQFFSTQQEIPVLTINTNNSNFVTNPIDFQLIAGRVRSVLHEGTYQRPLPQLDMPIATDQLLASGRPLADFQRFHDKLDRDKGFNTNMYFNYLKLCEEIGELGSELARLWLEEETLKRQEHTAPQAKQIALGHQSQVLESELADCMAYLLKMANYAGIDLETAYLKKMRQNQERVWRKRTEDQEA
jgi:deoxyadenosine/deoxycytidine kinase/NTP pyrophosphatase (non-canonical NTP hydrolase)